MSLAVSVSVLIVTLTAHKLLGAQEKTLEERVSNLEMLVSDLNSRLLQLEKQPSAKSTGGKAPNQNIPAGKVAWRTLQKDMTKAQVREILGEPRNIQMFGSFEIWSYKGSSRVDFDASGYVDGWSEP
ncbi:hypothetical protein INT08_04720 [Prosthecochloris sp. N3]|uniref:Lipoprotein SmpA/OmlA domain-containing protein n=1 Tax=Prosthecochloris ethylica TaxID=2743976 RepID=A0ABR9XRG4_9CHLB|nr:hypothetical protein [Prosthecochloris ethylica]MBF0586300.1 hypothetical protein [Prosthecochloris ethylica]MBF0636482.1 hypothetical protein [Prosthecochloris ethylica]NUK47656.1 hypothetical protein [Prosthecochloris ethylica]